MNKAWNENIYLTFDMDWAIDEVLEDFYELLKKYRVTGTIHVTHETKMLEEFRGDRSLDLGIHPNFNPLLQSGGENGTCFQVLEMIKQIVPEAVCVRSHALTNSSIIQHGYSAIGIKYDLNTLIPAAEGMVLYPFESVVTDLKILPFIYEDDVYMNFREKRSADFFLSDKFVAPRIFNFHPIHLYLNTDQNETYENARPYFKDVKKLAAMKNTKRYGTRDFFIELITCARNAGWQFQKIKDGDWG